MKRTALLPLGSLLLVSEISGIGVIGRASSTRGTIELPRILYVQASRVMAIRLRPTLGPRRLRRPQAQPSSRHPRRDGGYRSTRQGR